jgi:uncharacterized OsmC-like protein
MKMRAKIKNSQGVQETTLEVNGESHVLNIPPKKGGSGSSVSGGELLFLALATCFCNDLYREAKKLEIEVSAVEVEVEGEFGQEGEPARHITYRARVKSPEAKERLQDLMRVTDRMAEIQNTLRAGIPVTLIQEEMEKE